MLVFALLCPVLIYPLYLTLKDYHFNRNYYLLYSLFAYLIVGAVLELVFEIPFVGGIAGIFVNHFIYLLIGVLSTPEEVDKRSQERVEEEITEKERVESLEAYYDNMAAVKTYMSSDEHAVYLNDRRVLE